VSGVEPARVNPADRKSSHLLETPLGESPHNLLLPRRTVPHRLNSWRSRRWSPTTQTV